MPRRAAVPSGLAVLLLSTLSSFAAGPRRAPSDAALERLRGRAAGSIEAVRAPGRERVRTLRGPLTAPSAMAPRAVADRFVSDNEGLWGVAAADLSLAGSRDTPAGLRLSYRQSWSGLPVFDRGLDVYVARNGAVTLVHNDCATDPRVSSTAPGLSAAAAAARAIRAVAGPGALPERPVAPEAGIDAGTPDGPASPPRLAWRAVVVTGPVLDATEVFLDAASGSVLRRRSLVQDTHITGRGRVFDPNPVNVLRNTALRDLADADDPVFAPAYTIVDLPGLSRAWNDRFGAVVLNGPYVRINDLIERPYNAPTRSGDGDFFFGRDRLEFEMVMAYFHIDRSQRYIQSLGFTSINNRPVKVDPHGLNGVDNSHYVALPVGEGHIAFGEGGVDDAEDADVILHEYGHAIQDNTRPGAYAFPGETGAMGEGFGDYWAYTNGPTGPDAFDPACIAEWDFAGTCLRRVDGSKHYPEDIQREVHADGEIWSSALHTLAYAAGRATTDTLVLQSHALVPMFPKFCDGARALADADALLYGGVHAHAIDAAFAPRGIAPNFTVGPVLVTRDVSTGTDRVAFTIANAGPCAAGGAAHIVSRACNGPDSTVVARVTTDTLLRGDSVPFEVSVATAAGTCVYGVTADDEGAIAETREDDNTAFGAALP